MAIYFLEYNSMLIFWGYVNLFTLFFPPKC